MTFAGKKWVYAFVMWHENEIKICYIKKKKLRCTESKV